jgi:hypothetical protein
VILKNLFSGKVVVDAFVNDPGINSYFPISESIKHAPQWWKNLPKENHFLSERNVIYPASTMKRCVGFVEMYRTSFTIPLWADISISTNDKGDWAFFSNYKGVYINSHDRSQYGESFNDYVHLKLNSPWLLKEKSGINFLAQSPMWNNINLWNTVHIVPGFFEFKYQNSTNVNLFVNRINQNIQLLANTPIMQLVPLTEKKVVIKCHSVDENEYINIHKDSGHNFMFTKRILRVKKILTGNKK